MVSERDIERSVPTFYDHTATSVGKFLRGNSLAIHYRMNTPRDTDHILGERAKITSNDAVLDMGCGVGGSMLINAYQFGCSVDGVTISKNEARYVGQLITQRKLSDRVRVFQEDMCATHFPDANHTVVWAIESMCHIDQKQKFVKEAYRCLKPGGRLVMADFFLMNTFDPQNDLTDYERFKKGFLVPSLCTQDEFVSMLHDAGFTNVSFEDHTRHILHTVYIREISGWVNMLIAAPLWFLRVLPSIFMENTLGMIAQGRLFRHNKFSYGVIYAEK